MSGNFIVMALTSVNGSAASEYMYLSTYNDGTHYWTESIHRASGFAEAEAEVLLDKFAPGSEAIAVEGPNDSRV